MCFFLIFLFTLLSLTKQVESVPISFITFIIYVRIESREEGNGDSALPTTNSNSSRCSEKSLLSNVFKVKIYAIC